MNSAERETKRAFLITFIVSTLVLGGLAFGYLHIFNGLPPWWLTQSVTSPSKTKPMKRNTYLILTVALTALVLAYLLPLGAQTSADVNAAAQKINQQSQRLLDEQAERSKRADALLAGQGEILKRYQKILETWELLKNSNNSSCGGADALTLLLLPYPDRSGDMLGRCAAASHPPRSQSEQPYFFNRLLGETTTGIPTVPRYAPEEMTATEAHGLDAGLRTCSVWFEFWPDL